jgi:hypothetical protein
MHTSRLWRVTAVTAVAVGLAGAGTGPAIAAVAAASNSTSSVVIHTSSAHKKVTGDTFVTYRSPAQQTGKVYGTAPAGTGKGTATLMIEPFGATTYTASRTQTLTGSDAYSFIVTPAVATNYEVLVTSVDGTQTTSGARTIYVAAQGTVTGPTKCSRPTCHINLKVWVAVPPSALNTEMAKHWYLYSRLRLNLAHTPRAPKELKLNTSATSTKPRETHAYQFEVTTHFTFKIGGNAYRWRVDFCTKDSESVDGVGLPGRHGCGGTWISAVSPYLG